MNQLVDGNKIMNNELSFINSKFKINSKPGPASQIWVLNVSVLMMCDFR